MIGEHNARSGRKGGNANGRSFDQCFTESLAEPTTLIKWPSKDQRALWLMAAERVQAKRGSGEIHIYGNRYWAQELNAHAGTAVTVRFDPDHLMEPVQVYDLEDRLICVADCIADTGFFDVDAAREHNSKRNDYMRTLRKQKQLEVELSPAALGDIYGSRKRAASPQPEPPIHKRLAVGGTAPQPVRQQWTDEHEDAFTRAMNAVDEEKDLKVVKFPEGKGR